MKAFEDALHRLLFGFAQHASGRVLAAIALALYAGLGLALPLALDWPVTWLVSANIVGTAFAGTLILIWFAARVQASNRRHLIEWTSDLRLLDSTEFEWLVGEVFRRDGWKVEETGRRDAPDGNVDLRLTKREERVLVQCKRWQSKVVGVDDVRAFAGTLMREGLPGTNGIFVTLSDFSEQAQGEAKQVGLVLVDNRDLYERVERVRRNEPCPVCHSPMLLDRSGFGWWFRCVTPGCTGKRDLGRDPARAVELLTEPPS
jgi:HJR/Mrr/RecB family endonuclease